MLSLLENVRDANQRLQLWFENIVPRNAQTAVPSPEQMAALLSELLRVGASLRAEPTSGRGHNRTLDAELETYRRNVERLRDVLPAIHDQLLAERARLEGQRARVRSVAEWARASQQTL